MKKWWKSLLRNHPNLLTNLGMALALLIIIAGLAVAVATGQEFSLFFAPVPDTMESLLLVTGSYGD